MTHASAAIAEKTDFNEEPDSFTSSLVVIRLAFEKDPSKINAFRILCSDALKCQRKLAICGDSI